VSVEEKKELEHYRNLFSVGEHNVAVSGYLTYVEIVRQQVEYLKEFKIKSNIDGKKTETAMYDRSEAMWKNLPDMISSLNKLRFELKIDFDPMDGKQKQMATTPQSIAKIGKQE
jgi:hypothetical protein